jgi:hypothetical protein
MLARIWIKRIVAHCSWEYKLLQPVWKAVWRFLKEIHIKAYHMNPAILPLYISGGNEVNIPKNTREPMFIAALVTLAKMQPRCLPTNT